jgi:hypothetical protein
MNMDLPKPLFTLPEMFSLNGDKMTADTVVWAACGKGGVGCSTGCADGCASGCELGRGGG